MRFLSRLFRPAPLTAGDSGRLAQRYVEKYLRKCGCKIVASNVADRDGELDLVVRPRDFHGIAVVEVRSHAHNTTLRQEEVLPPSKQQQVVESARRLLPRMSILTKDDNLRFDAALVRLDASGKPDAVEYIENAFTADRRDWF